jgi:hypothetical protein
MRYALIALLMFLCSLTPAAAQLSINFGLPGVHIGINLPVYPQLQRVPGYPVYYAPGVNSNYFFYDGLYWVFEGDNWYASSWYNGPWWMVDRMDVPLYLLRVPVRFYRHAPAYFQGWRANDPPRWGEHWGQSWAQRRSGWDQWNRRSAPAPAPLPAYQRQYSGNRYPQPSQQAVIQTRDYRYKPSDAVAQQQFQHYRAQAQSARPQQAAPQQRQQQSQQPRPQQAAPQQQVQQPQQAQQPQRQSQQKGQSQQAHEKAPPGREQNREQGREIDNKERGRER